MYIVIPSAGRPDKQPTLKAMPINSLRGRLFLVVRKEDRLVYRKWKKDCQVISCPAAVQGVAATRQWVLENFQPKVCMLDDDMTFSARTGDGVALKKATPSDIEKMFDLLESWLDEGFLHVGVSQRAGNNRIKSPFVETTRMNNVYAFRSKEILEVGGRFDRLKVMEDFDLTLQLLRKGYKNRVTYDYAWGQGQSGAEGGCSLYRTWDMQRKAAQALQVLHPGLVKIKIKKSKKAWEGIGDERVDVNIAWKQAYNKG
jgi:hypothetical protein